MVGGGPLVGGAGLAVRLEALVLWVLVGLVRLGGCDRAVRRR